jgi:hypothetical protein
VVLVGDTARKPLVAFVPVQPPAAVHEIALVEDQVTIESWPEVMLAGLAENAKTILPVLLDGSAASAAGEASTKDWSANVEARALASQGRALKSE